MNFHKLECRPGYLIEAYISNIELSNCVRKNIVHIVSERLAEDLYNKYKDDLLKEINSKHLAKICYKKLEKLLTSKIEKIKDLL